MRLFSLLQLRFPSHQEWLQKISEEENGFSSGIKKPACGRLLGDASD